MELVKAIGARLSQLWLYGESRPLYNGELAGRKITLFSPDIGPQPQSCIWKSLSHAVPGLRGKLVPLINSLIPVLTLILTAVCPLKLGFASFSFPYKTAISEVIGVVSAAGYRGLEINAWNGYATNIVKLDHRDWARIREATEAAGLEISALGCDASYIKPDEASRRESVARAMKTVDVASDLGVRVVDTFSGAVPEQMPGEKAWPILIRSISEVAAHAAERDVRIAFEAHVGMPVDSPEALERLLAEVSSEYLAVNLDASHFSIRGWDVTAIARRLGRLIAHSHVKDTRGSFPDFRFLIPGEGDFPFEEFLSALAGTGYNGFVTAEISVMRSRLPGYDAAEAARMAYRRVVGACRAVGLQLG